MRTPRLSTSRSCGYFAVVRAWKTGAEAGFALRGRSRVGLEVDAEARALDGAGRARGGARGKTC